MRKLNKDKRTMIINALVEGMSVNATARICSVSKLTVLRLLADVGSLCLDFHDIAVRGLHCKRIQCDEIWSFVGCKAKSKEQGKQGHGDSWTWIAIDAPRAELQSLRASPSIYLVESIDYLEDFDLLVEDTWEWILKEQLNSWMRNAELWPNALSRTMFHEWFDCELSTMIWDMLKTRIKPAL